MSPTAVDASFDLVVLGAGSAGVRAARVAARHGARVALVEEGRVGGTCVLRGCVPKKLYAYAAAFGRGFEEARGFGWRGEHAFDWPALVRAKDAELARLEGIYAGMLADAGVELRHGAARLRDRHTVAVGDAVLRAEHVLIATGAEPRRPDWPGAELALSSDDVFDLPSFPRRLLVVGGGYIACEFASIFDGLGAQVHLVHRRARVLQGFDEDVRAHLMDQWAAGTMALHMGRELRWTERVPGGSIAVGLDDGDRLEVDAVLAAIGRVPRTAGLGLAALGVELDADGAVKVDAASRTSVDNIHAAGDVTSRLALTPVAIREGQAVVDRLFGAGADAAELDYARVPKAVFSHPGVAMVGLTEHEARERCAQVAIHAARFRPLRATLSGSPERTLMKLVVDDGTGRVLGAHMVGDEAAEIMQGLAIAISAGVTKAQLDATLGIHPTSAEEFVTLKPAAAA